MIKKNNHDTLKITGHKILTIQNDATGSFITQNNILKSKSMKKKVTNIIIGNKITANKTIKRDTNIPLTLRTIVYPRILYFQGFLIENNLFLLFENFILRILYLSKRLLL